MSGMGCLTKRQERLPQSPRPALGSTETLRHNRNLERVPRWTSAKLRGLRRLPLQGGGHAGVLERVSARGAGGV